MTTPGLDETEFDRRRIRIGLAMLTLVVFGAVVASFFIESPVGKTLMAGIVIFTLVRAFMLTRSLRRDRAKSV